ncbi:unnamed protein product (macronuclear) [Paramecium tetraurelia]|uniref:Myb-like DNA-binding domain protein n=1 Tax=Paramecium tetraurelia TaxID=5888 RepID=A0C6L6_PARTE|nr:uncharacterized protein GSPATT00035562001 [Paramecium tetraurelia]CAK66433.1 unnamed protein product [Paramecium tetraurelia]|eukprot:XP_001433830.1 hypothetical protein (macronuclear) [Paramecium tetraurelia strain d4-2]
MLDLTLPQCKKRILWTEDEDKLLKYFVSKFQNERLGWKMISQALRKQGYDRNTKACRERFFNYLDISYNKSVLSQFELDKLFDLIKIHGNKWTCIAKELNHRTDQDIKNQFYAHVKKVFRRLLKASYKTNETTQGSIITAKLQPLLISSIFCHDNEIDRKQIDIKDDMKELFKSLIRENKSIQQGENINEDTREKVKQISLYLEKENQIYLQNKITRKEKKLQEKTKQTNQKIKNVYSEFQQQKILEKIQNKKPIFLSAIKMLDHPSIKFDANFQNSYIYEEQSKNFDNQQQHQIISYTPFNYQQSYKNDSFYSPDLIQVNNHFDSYNYPTIWNA